jgi:[acyl-carrier-protein] S-malonyltransferase
MTEFGADTFIEAGPGKTLAGFNKRIDKKITTHNVENEESLEKTLDYFREVG